MIDPRPASTPRRVLVATAEPLGHRQAGPAIRARSIAELLGAVGHEVTLASTAPHHERADSRGISVMGRSAVHGEYDVVVLQGRVLLEHPELHASPACIVVDLYDPFQLEALHRGGPDRIRRIDLVEGAILTLGDQITRGDFFLSSSERQRDFWLGHLSAAGRLNAATSAHDHAFRRLIDIAPFGIAATPPEPGPSTLRTAHGFGPDDPLVLWAGGLHDWLDPLTAVNALDIARREVPDIRLVFWGATHPNPEYEEPQIVQATRARAQALGLWGDHVAFHPEWVPFADRGALLLDATIGISTQLDHLESRFSYRTRLLDHLWAGLPTVATSGDPLSDTISAAGAGIACAAEDPQCVADALVHLSLDPEARHAASTAATELAATMGWEQSLEPLLRFVNDPHRAPDLVDRTIAPIVNRSRPEAIGGIRHYIERGRRHVAESGAKGLGRRALASARRRTLGR